MDLDRLDRASTGFATTLSRVTVDDWPAPSINPGWTVRDLVNHVIGGNRRYILLLHGEPTEVVEANRNDDHVGCDPHTAFATTAGEVAAAFREPGALTRTVHHRKGDRSGADLLTMRVMEHALHGWDLARSITTDDAIDPAVIEAILTAIDADPTLLPRSGYPPTGPRESSGQSRLLALTGRRSPPGR